MKRLFIFIFPLVLVLTLFQTVLLQERKILSKNKPASVKYSELENVRNIVQSVLSMQDPRIVAKSLGQIADLAWNIDEDYARSLFSVALNKLTVNEKDSPREISSKTSVYHKVISLIAKHDPNWTKELVASFAQDSDRRAKTNLEVANSLLETDPKRAADFASQSVQIEVTEGLIWFLRQLRQQDQNESNRLFLQIVSRYPQQENASTYQYALLGTYLFTSPRADPEDYQAITITRVGNFGMPNITANLPNIPTNLIKAYLQSAITLINRPSNNEDRQVKYALGYLLVAKAQEFAPNLVGDLIGAMASLASYVPPEIATEAAYKNMTKKAGSPEDRIKEIEKMADSYTRDQLFLDVVFQAYRRHDFEIAKLATSKIDDKDLQDELETLILFGEANELLKGKKVDFVEAVQMIGKLPEGLEKTLLRLALASVADKSKNKALEEEMLGSARDSAKMLNNETTPFLLMYISGQMKTNADSQSSTVLAEAMKVFNQFENIKDPLLEHKVTLEPLTLRFPLAVKDVNLGFQTSFLNAVSGDEDNAILMVNDIKDERLKGQAYVALAKSILVKRPATTITNIQEKVVRVGEDGIRKSAAKVVMPIYPATSLKNKAKGVAVAEVQFNGEGAVTEVKILESPDSSTGQSVTDAMKQWKFKPSQLEGKPISVRGKITFYFAVNEKGKGEVKNPKQFQ